MNDSMSQPVSRSFTRRNVLLATSAMAAAYVTPVHAEEPRDGAMIQTQIDDIANNNGFVRIEPGHWKLKEPLRISHKKSLTLEGSGPSTVLEADFDDAPAIDLLEPTGSRETYRLIRDMVITRASDKRSSPNACGIRTNGQSFLTVANVVFLQHQWGVRADNGEAEWRINDCIFTFGCANGIQLNKTINVYLRGCYFEPSGIGIEVKGGAHSVHISQCQIVNGSGYDYGVILDNGGESSVLMDCVFEGARQSCVYFANAAKDSLIANCWFGKALARDSKKGGGNAVKVDPMSERITISNNRFGGQIGPAITIDRVRNALILGNRFEDNCRASDDAHIHLFGCENTMIANNSFEWCSGLSAIIFEVAGVDKRRNKNILLSGNDFSLLNAFRETRKLPALIGIKTIDGFEKPGNLLGDTSWE